MSLVFSGYDSNSDSDQNDAKQSSDREKGSLQYGAQLVEQQLQMNSRIQPDTQMIDTNKKRLHSSIIEHKKFDAAAFDLLSSTYDQRLFKSNQKKRQKTQIKKKLNPWESSSSSSSESESSSTSSINEDNGNTIESANDDEKQNRLYLTNNSNKNKMVTKFFGKREFDDLGKSYLSPPQDIKLDITKDPGSQECFVPKRQIHVWDGHIGGVSKLQFFPNTGHLLLSGGNDNNIHIYDTFHRKQLLRGFYGHTKSIRDLDFDPSGRKFASCGFDKKINIWDTERGVIVQSYTHMSSKVNYNCIKFNPMDENVLLTGLSNAKIEHYDMRIAPTVTNSDYIVQVYDHHLDSIKSLTFFKDGKKFLSTSDDKSVRIWELGINIPIKFISDPTQFSMPKSKIYPSGKYFGTQAMNNKIMIYQTVPKYKQNKKKVFGGHLVAGYGIDFAFSPDGKIVMSGSSDGKAYFWDWKSTRIVKSYQIDTDIISCIEPHPQEVSRVAMAGNGGKIFYWE